MPNPIINGTVWATWNGIILPPRRPVLTFDSPVLRGTGASVLPQRSPVSQVRTVSFVPARADADNLIGTVYGLLGFLITAQDDEGVTYTNLFVKDAVCNKPRPVQGQTNDGTAGLCWMVAAEWSFIAALPENQT